MSLLDKKMFMKNVPFFINLISHTKLIPLKHKHKEQFYIPLNDILPDVNPRHPFPFH